jgi:hypothetical protein
MFKSRNSRGFAVAELATIMGVTALLATILVPTFSSVGTPASSNSIITVSETGTLVAEPETLPVEAILVNITNTSTGITISKTVNDPNATSTTINNLDSQANYTVEVAKKSLAGVSPKATASVNYIKVAEETKVGSRPIVVDDQTKPIMVDNTSRPIYGQVDRGSYKSRTVWVDTSYYYSCYQSSGYTQSSGYWSTCGGGSYACGSTPSTSCSQVYSHYACFNSACTRGEARYSTSCSTSYSTNWCSNPSYSCYVDTSRWIDTSGYTSCLQSQGYNTSESYWSADVKTEVVGYDKMVSGYEKKTIQESYNYQVDVNQAVTTEKTVTAPAGHLVLEVPNSAKRNIFWASGTVAAIGSGVTGFDVGEEVDYRMGQIFEFDGKKYIKVQAMSFLVK